MDQKDEDDSEKNLETPASAPESAPASAPESASEPTGEKTTAWCKDDLKYGPGKAFLSITFSLANENPFDVWVSSSSKKDSQKVYPILYEIRDLENDPNNPILIKPLKNKGCIKKISDDLAKHLTRLNELLLNEYSIKYNAKDLNILKEKQDDFRTKKIRVKTDDNKEDTEDSDGITKPLNDFNVNEILTKWDEKTTCKQGVIDKIGTTPKQIKKDISTEQIKKLIAENKDNNPDIHIAYNTKVLEDAAYLGSFKYKTTLIGSESEQHVFLTKKGILTDGYAILSIDKDVYDEPNKTFTFTKDINKPYSSLWKLSNKDGLNSAGKKVDEDVNGGRNIVVEDLDTIIGNTNLFGYKETTEYDKAIFILAEKNPGKYGGKRNTLSNKPDKKHKTRRVR
jgi:hypothetical protein